MFFLIQVRSDSPDSGGGGYFTLSDSDGGGGADSPLRGGGADSPFNDEDDNISNSGTSFTPFLSESKHCLYILQFFTFRSNNIVMGKKLT